MQLADAPLEKNDKTMRLRDFSFDLHSLSDFDTLRNEIVVTVNSQLFVSYFVDFELGKDAAELKTCLDSRIINIILKLSRRPVPEVLAGSEIIFPLIKRGETDRKRICFVGLTTEYHDKFHAIMASNYPHLNYLLLSPKVNNEGFVEEEYPVFGDKILGFDPDIIFSGLGAIKQERFNLNMKKLFFLNNVAFDYFIGVGGTLDFIVGRQQRCPKFIKILALEWLFRLCTNWRMIKRYPKMFKILVNL